jgi:hypothetical protein
VLAAARAIAGRPYGALMAALWRIYLVFIAANWQNLACLYD